MMDLCESLPDDPAGGCDVIAGYVAECQDAGGIVGDWRSGTVCGKSHVYRYSADHCKLLNALMPSPYLMRMPDIHRT